MPPELEDMAKPPICRYTDSFDIPRTILSERDQTFTPTFGSALSPAPEASWARQHCEALEISEAARGSLRN